MLSPVPYTRRLFPPSLCITTRDPPWESPPRIPAMGQRTTNRVSQCHSHTRPGSCQAVVSVSTEPRVSVPSLRRPPRTLLPRARMLRHVYSAQAGKRDASAVTWLKIRSSTRPRPRPSSPRRPRLLRQAQFNRMRHQSWTNSLHFRQRCRCAGDLTPASLI
jgi:hypothetical protein